MHLSRSSLALGLIIAARVGGSDWAVSCASTAWQRQEAKAGSKKKRTRVPIAAVRTTLLERLRGVLIFLRESAAVISSMSITEPSSPSTYHSRTDRGRPQSEAPSNSRPLCMMPFPRREAGWAPRFWYRAPYSYLAFRDLHASAGTNRERICWRTRAESAATLATFRFAVGMGSWMTISVMPDRTW